MNIIICGAGQVGTHAAEALAQDNHEITVIDEDAIPLHRAERPQKPALLLGSEGLGLPQELIDLCDQKVTIPMQHNTDSLNVAVAAGVFLHHFISPDRS